MKDELLASNRFPLTITLPKPVIVPDADAEPLPDPIPEPLADTEGAPSFPQAARSQASPIMLTRLKIHRDVFMVCSLLNNCGYDFCFVYSSRETFAGRGLSASTSADQVTRAGHHCQTPSVTILVSPAGRQATLLTETSRLITLVEAPHRFR